MIREQPYIEASLAAGFVILVEAASACCGSLSSRVSRSASPCFGFNVLGDALRDLLDPRLKAA